MKIFFGPPIFPRGFGHPESKCHSIVTGFSWISWRNTFLKFTYGILNRKFWFQQVTLKKNGMNPRGSTFRLDYPAGTSTSITLNSAEVAYLKRRSWSLRKLSICVFLQHQRESPYFWANKSFISTFNYLNTSSTPDHSHTGHTVSYP